MSSVFKYTDYRKEFFDDFFLKASRLGEFNDPFEIIIEDYLSDIDKIDHELAMLVSGTSSDIASYYNHAWSAQSGARSSISVLCFSSRGDNPLMWARHAKNHGGICIEFDKKADFFNGKYKDATKTFDNPTKDHCSNIGKLRKVEYKLERPAYHEPNEFGYDTECWFIKSPEWKYEKEERLLLPLDLAQKVSGLDIPFYAVSPQIIRSITLGCLMPDSIKREVVEHCKNQGIKVREAFIHRHQFKLNIVDYNEFNKSNI